MLAGSISDLCKAAASRPRASMASMTPFGAGMLTQPGARGDVTNTASHRSGHSARPVQAWTGEFPARPEQVGQARKFLAAALGGCPATDDAVLCLSELVGNSVLHSASRRPGACSRCGRKYGTATTCGSRFATTAARGTSGLARTGGRTALPSCAR